MRPSDLLIHPPSEYDKRGEQDQHGKRKNEQRVPLEGERLVLNAEDASDFLDLTDLFSLPRGELTCRRGDDRQRSEYNGCNFDIKTPRVPWRAGYEAGLRR